MNRDQVLVQLGAIRAICDALAASLLAETTPRPDGGCDHPEDQRQDVSTLGGPKQFFCKACKEFVAADSVG